MSATSHSSSATHWRQLLLIIAVFSLQAPATLSSQQTGEPPGQPAENRRTLSARRVTGALPEIDGRLHDNAWLNADAATDFIQREPAAEL